MLFLYLYLQIIIKFNTSVYIRVTDSVLTASLIGSGEMVSAATFCQEPLESPPVHPHMRLAPVLIMHQLLEIKQNKIFVKYNKTPCLQQYC